MKRFRTALSFGHDLNPVETVRDEFDAMTFEEAIRQAVFRGFPARQKRWPARSVVVVVEDLTPPAEKTTTTTGGASDPSHDRVTDA